MENGIGPVPDRADAAALLAAHDRMIARQDPPAASRSLIRFRIWAAALTAAYVVAVVIIATARDHDSSVTTILVPVTAFIAASALATETEQRFSVRRRTRVALTLTIGLGAAVLVGFFWAIDAPLPIWGAAALGLAVFAALAVPEWRRLSRRRAADDARDAPWLNRPLSGEARLITWVMAAYLGALLVLLRFGDALDSGAITFVVLYGPLLALTFLPNRGLRRIGAEWGPVHWTAFGLGLVAILSLAPAVHAELPGSGALCIGAGIVVFLLLGLSAQLPLRGDAGDPTSNTP